MMTKLCRYNAFGTVLDDRQIDACARFTDYDVARDEIARLNRYIQIVESYLDRETLKEVLTKYRSSPDGKADEPSDDRDPTPPHLLKQGYRSGKISDPEPFICRCIAQLPREAGKFCAECGRRIPTP